MPHELLLLDMKKIFFITILVVGIALLVYLNYSYGVIYKKIDDVGLQIPSDFEDFSQSIPSSSLKYVAIGDSLTAGVGVDSYLKSYPYLLSQKIAQKNISWNLVPFAVPGARSSYILSDIIGSVIKEGPNITTLFIGINDVHGNVSLKKFRNNYESILKKLTEETNSKIYVINLPYIGTQDLIGFPYEHYFNSRTKKYNLIIKDLAQKYDVEHIDLYEGNIKYVQDKEYYSLDLFHPNEKGYALWADIMYANFSK